MRNAGLDEAQAGIKIAGRNINNLRYADCEAARANTMTGSPDLSLDFPWNGKIPYPHQAAQKGTKGTYRGKAKKPANT